LGGRGLGMRDRVLNGEKKVPAGRKKRKHLKETQIPTQVGRRVEEIA